MNAKELGLNVLTVVSCLCAVTVTSLLLWKEFGGEKAASNASARPVQVPNWREVAAVGHRIGPRTARVTITEFVDFQCPVCREFAQSALRGVRQKYGDQVTIVFRHWPLPYHHLAHPSARAAECAGAQGQFERYHDLLYAKQDSIGLKSFVAFALESGVTDTGRFSRCVTTEGLVDAIEADIKAAAEVGGTGTPTLLINGSRLAGAPDSARFDKLIRAALQTGPESR